MAVRTSGDFARTENGIYQRMLSSAMEGFGPLHADLLSVFKKQIHFQSDQFLHYREEAKRQLQHFHQEVLILGQQLISDLQPVDDRIINAMQEKIQLEAEVEEQWKSYKLKQVIIEQMLSQKITEWTKLTNRFQSEHKSYVREKKEIQAQILKLENHALTQKLQNLIERRRECAQEIAHLAGEIAETRDVQIGLEHRLAGELSSLEESIQPKKDRIATLEDMIAHAVQQKANIVTGRRAQAVMLEYGIQGNTNNKIADLTIEQQRLVDGLETLARAKQNIGDGTFEQLQEIEANACPLVSRLVEVDAMLVEAIDLKGRAIVPWTI